MEKPNTAVHRIDQNDVIYYINDFFKEFAGQNHANPMFSQDVLGKSLWDFITDDTTVQLHRHLIDKVRNTQHPIHFYYRCDSSEIKREVKMSILPLKNHHVEFQNQIYREETREPIKLFDMKLDRSGDAIRMCGWCHAIHWDGHWIEIENAKAAISRFMEDCHPQISHGICKTCYEKMSAILNQLD